MIPYDIIKELVVSGIMYSYESYDHNAAVEEYKMNGVKIFNFNNYHSWDIPIEIKLNHVVWRKGKLRQIQFDSKSNMVSFLIGNKRYKRFYINDFGVSVKPIIFKSDDKYNLISQGLAVEDYI